MTKERAGNLQRSFLLGTEMSLVKGEADFSKDFPSPSFGGSPRSTPVNGWVD